MLTTPGRTALLVRDLRGAAPLVVVLLAAAPALAGTDLGAATVSGHAGVGGRFVVGDDDEAKFEEYRDIPKYGVISDFDLRLDNGPGTWFMRGRGENAGYDDQRFGLEIGRYGRFSLEAFYGELPHIFSRDAMTPYMRMGGANTFVLPGAFDITAPDPALFGSVKQGIKWREGGLGARFHAGESVTLRSSYRIQEKEGRSNFGLGFGSPGGRFSSVPGRIDERIHEARVGVDWAAGDCRFSAEYLGNLYDNSLRSLTADNAAAIGGVAPGNAPGLVGRLALAPDNWAQSLSLAGATRLPLDMPNQVSGSFTYGYRYQDDSFLPHTIDPGIVDPDLTLPASSLEGKVQTILGTLQATFEPGPNSSARIRYRIYDFDNQTDSLLFPGNVRNDGTLNAGDPHMSVANDYRRQNGDLDMTWRFNPEWNGTLGFGWENWHRSRAREVADLNEYGPSIGLDHQTAGGNLLHAGYEFRTRDGSRYRPLAPIDVVVGPGEDCATTTNKLCAIRKFDQADRFLHRANVLARLVPTEVLEITFNGTADYADYRNSSYGLTDAFGWQVGTDAAYEIHPRVALLGYYTFEWRELAMRSRERGVMGGLPVDVGDWKSETRYQYHNAGTTLRLALLPAVLDADVGYLVQYGQEETRATGIAAPAPNLPRIHDLLQTVYTELGWHVTEQVTLKGGYRFEDYSVDNFRDDNVPASLSDAPGSSNLYLGDVLGDYTAHVFMAGAEISF
jgi:MtrB/PioB family decaheme-associated outer membrane protein